MNQTVKVNEINITAGEKTIYGRLYEPSDNKKKHSAIILSHGYNGCNMDFEKECIYFAENGYVAFAYDFCGGSTRSKSSGQSTDMTIFTEKADLLDVYQYISGLDMVDEGQVFLFGGSQGGLVTALATEELASKVKGMVLYYPALCIADDWRKTYPTIQKMPETNNFWDLTLGKIFFESIHDFYTFDQIGSYKGAVLIIHGDADEVVSLEYSKEALEKYSKAKLIVLEGEGHGYSEEGVQRAMEHVLDFMKRL